MTQCFLLEPTDLARESLRRFVLSAEARGCRHAAERVVAVGVPWPGEGASACETEPDPDDARWPAICDRCGAPMPGDAQRQHLFRRLYRGPAGALMTLEEAPPGAMWHADWLLTLERYQGISCDGHIVRVRLPDGTVETLDQPQPSKLSAAVIRGAWKRYGSAPRCTVPGLIQSGELVVG